MTQAMEIILATLLAEDFETLPGVIIENWPCTSPDERQLLGILMRGQGGTGNTSEGGYDAEDAGKVPVFAADGGLILTNSLKIFEDVGRTNYWAIGTGDITGERDVSVTDASGRIPTIVVDIPADSDAAGSPGMIAMDGDWFYVYVPSPVAKWRRAQLNEF